MVLTGVSPATARKFDKLFAKRERVFSLMFDETPHYSIKLAGEEELDEVLLNGADVYWKLVFDNEDNVCGIVPYSIEDVILKLRQTDDLADTFYDFNQRL